MPQPSDNRDLILALIQQQNTFAQHAATQRAAVTSRAEYDLTEAAKFKMDGKTILVLLALAFQWWNQRSTLQYLKETVAGLQRQLQLQQYETGSIKLSLAEKGFHFRKPQEE